MRSDMSVDFAMALSSEMIWTGILIAAPILGLALLVGLFVSVFQVVTQIQEMSLTFIPKIITVALALVAFGPWMLRTLIEFARTIIGNIPAYF